MKKSTIGTTIAILIVLTAIIGGAVYHTQKNNRFVHSTTATLFSMVVEVVIVQKPEWLMLQKKRE